MARPGGPLHAVVASMADKPVLSMMTQYRVMIPQSSAGPVVGCAPAEPLPPPSTTFETRAWSDALPSVATAADGQRAVV